MGTISRSGFRYILTFVDRKSRFLKIYLIRKKSDVTTKTKEFLSWVKTQKEKTPKKISSDYGGEYTCHDLQNFCRSLGIEWEFTEADTPQQNGIAERINRTIVEGSSAMSRTAGLPEEFWEDAVMYFVHIKNRTPHKSMDKRTPIDVWNGGDEEEARGVWGFKTFGCEGYKAMGNKKERGKRMVYLGVCENRKTDKFYDMEKEKVVFGYCRYFDEDCFPMKRRQKQQSTGTGDSTGVLGALGSSLAEIGSGTERGGEQDSKEEVRGEERDREEERREWWRLLFDEAELSDTEGEEGEYKHSSSDITMKHLDSQSGKQGARGTERGEEERNVETQEGRETETKEHERTWRKGSYEIEYIVDKRKSRFGKKRGYDYMVKWKGDWGEDSQQWLPQHRLRYAKEAIHKYETEKLLEDEEEGVSSSLRGIESDQRSSKHHNINTILENTDTRPTPKNIETESMTHEKAKAFLADVTKLKKKQLTRKEASQRTDWDQFLKAEGEEIRNGFDTGCIRSVDRCDIPKDATILGSMMVYKKKEATALEPARYRSRMCVLGNRQKPDSYSETFAAVAKVKTFRVLLALAVHLGMRMSQLDISNAFMNSRLPEEIYMYPPKGWEHLGILRLNNSLYGLKQAPRLWYDTLTGKLKSLGFEKLESDVCCFKHPSKRCYVLIYVDDVIIMTNDELMRYNLVEELKREFKLRNFESARLYVGLELVWESDRVVVTQTTMTKDLLQAYRHENAESVSTPEESKLRLENATGKLTKAPYRELVGSLLFLLSTRPDISGAVRALSQFMQSATNKHWTAAKRVLAYLKGTATAGICYIKEEKFKIHAYSDSDFAEHRKDRKSIGAYVCYAQGGPVVWKSKKQPVIAQSSAEAEYIALAECVKDLIWLKMLLWELEVEVDGPVVVYIDNAAAKALAENAIDHDRSKHIDVRYHLIRHHVELGWLKIRKVDSKWNVADVLTKPVAENVFRKLVGKLLNYTKFGCYSVSDR